MSPGDDCLISNVLRGVVLAGEESRLGSKLAEVAPGVTSSWLSRLSHLPFQRCLPMQAVLSG